MCKFSYLEFYNVCHIQNTRVRIFILFLFFLFFTNPFSSSHFFLVDFHFSLSDHVFNDSFYIINSFLSVSSFIDLKHRRVLDSEQLFIREARCRKSKCWCPLYGVGECRIIRRCTLASCSNTRDLVNAFSSAIASNFSVATLAALMSNNFPAS